MWERAASTDKEGFEQVQMRDGNLPRRLGCVTCFRPVLSESLGCPCFRNEDPRVAKASSAADEMAAARCRRRARIGTWRTLGTSPQPSSSPQILPPQERFPCQTHPCRPASCEGVSGLLYQTQVHLPSFRPVTRFSVQKLC